MRWLWFEETSAGSPDHNMATDLALFEAIRDGGLLSPVLRVYRWDRPSVSIGRLQDAAAVRALYPDLPLVRRPTGGRAVVHGDDLTISVITRDTWLPVHEKPGVLSSYSLILSGIVDALQAAGFSPAFGAKRGRSSAERSPRCFDFAAACDIIDTHSGRKLLGSAQRREHGAILQQMDIPDAAAMDEQRFLIDLKRCMATIMGISEWLCVDTLPAL